MAPSVYLAANRTTQQTIPSKETWGDKFVIMNDHQGVGIQYDNNTGSFTLEKDKTYRITAQLGWEANTPEYYKFGLFNKNTGEQIGPLAEALPPKRNTCNASGDLLDVIFTPRAAGQTYCLRIAPGVTAPSSSKIRADVSTFLNIVPLADAQFEPLYLSARRSSKQKLLRGGYKWGNVRILMNDVQKDSTIPYDVSGNFTLEKGKKYRITAQLGWEASTPEYYKFGLFNADTDEQIGPLAEALPPNLNTYNASSGVLDVIHAPTVTGKYYLKMSSDVTAPRSSVIRDDVSTFLNVVEVSTKLYGETIKRLTNQTIPSGTWSYKKIVTDANNENEPCQDKIFLKKGDVIRVTAKLGWEAKTPEFYAFGWFNVDTDQKFGTLAEALPPNANTCNASGGVLDTIFTVDRDTYYTLRMTRDVTAPATSSVRADVSTSWTIVQLSSTPNAQQCE
jgi:hypothetical protein